MMELVQKRKRNQPTRLGNPLINQQDKHTSTSNQIQPFDQLNPSLDASQSAFELLEGKPHFLKRSENIDEI
jgi:hypothetical protein